MKVVPMIRPIADATAVQPSESPRPGPMKPIGIEKYWKLPRNHNGAWCQSLPCRSVSGTQSMDRTSIAPARGALVA